MNVLGIDIPMTSMKPVRRTVHELRYVSSGYDSPSTAKAADWLQPTSLDFPTETITSSRVTAQVALPAVDGGVPLGILPEVFEQACQEAALSVARHLRRNQHVADTAPVAGFMYDLYGMPILHAQVNAWPAVEGVTVPRRDTTM